MRSSIQALAGWNGNDGAATRTRRLPPLRVITATVYPQWLRTVLAVVVWLSTMLIYIRAVSPYATYDSAWLMGVGLCLLAGTAAHVWPTATPAWRTVVWTGVVSAVTGSMLLLLGWDRYALTGAMLAGLLLVTLRVNRNGNRLARLFRTWRDLR